MPKLEQEFEKAAKEAKQLSSRPSDATLLKLYALYKQASVGDVSGKRPGMLDFVGRAKFDAWENLKGTTPQASMKEYIAMVKELRLSCS